MFARVKKSGRYEYLQIVHNERVDGRVHGLVCGRGEFTSLDALRQRLLDFIDYFNRTMAKPYRWTYTGKPLTI